MPSVTIATRWRDSLVGQISVSLAKINEDPGDLPVL